MWVIDWRSYTATHILHIVADRRHKRKMALNRLDALEQELDGIEETEEELQIISEHVEALEHILRGAEKSVCQHF